MLEKRDRIYYHRLSYVKILLGICIIGACFIEGVAANYQTSEIHVFAPYWVGIPLILQGLVILTAARNGKRWPLGVWIIFFLITICAITAYIIVYPAFHTLLFDRYPCFVEKNYWREKTRCICALDEFEYLTVKDASSSAPCIRALNIMLIFGNTTYMLSILSLIPMLLCFVLVCNDICCISCRRAAGVPQVFVTGGQAGGAGQQLVAVQQQTVTYRTDEQAGSSAGQQHDPSQAGPLPTKPRNPSDIPHSF